MSTAEAAVAWFNVYNVTWNKCTELSVKDTGRNFSPETLLNLKLLTTALRKHNFEWSEFQHHLDSDADVVQFQRLVVLSK
jgi:hypothetical protein